MQSDLGSVHIGLLPSGLHSLKPWYMQLQKFIFALVWWSKCSSSHVLRSFLPTQLNPPWRHIAFLELWATCWSNERNLKRVNFKNEIFHPIHILIRIPKSHSEIVMLDAASQKKIHTLASVWYKIGLLWTMIEYLRSAGMLFSRHFKKSYGLGLSKELLCITMAQAAAKLWPFKIGGLKKIRHFGYKAIFINQGNSTKLDL